MSESVKLRAILIDDEFKGLNSLHILLTKHCPKVRSVAETRNPESAIDLIENYQPDIVFLDINMPKMNGFELLEKLKWRNFDLIFTTAHQEYALKALKENALDYLLKPIDPDELKASVNKVFLRRLSFEKRNQPIDYSELLRSLKETGKQKVIVHSKNGIDSVEVNSIICMESKSNYTQMYLDGNHSLMSSKTLKEYELMLCEQNDSFMRVHNSFIINLRKVSRYIRANEIVVMQNNQEIPVSKSRKEDFLKWLNL